MKRVLIPKPEELGVNFKKIFKGLLKTIDPKEKLEIIYSKPSAGTKVDLIFISYEKLTKNFDLKKLKENYLSAKIILTAPSDDRFTQIKASNYAQYIDSYFATRHVKLYNDHTELKEGREILMSYLKD